MHTKTLNFFPYLTKIKCAKPKIMCQNLVVQGLKFGCAWPKIWLCLAQPGTPYLTPLLLNIVNKTDIS